MNIADPLYYNWSTFMRKNHLSEKEIHQFEMLGEQAIAIELQKLGTSQAGKLFWLMLQSFRVADAVAKAAWGYTKALENQDQYNAEQEYAAVVRALNDYSPGNFTPHRGDIKFAAEYFEKLFNELQNHPLPQWEEVLFRWTARLHEMLDGKGAPLTVPDPQRISNGMAQNEKNIFPCVVLDGIAHIERTDNAMPLCDICDIVKGFESGPTRALALPTCPKCIQLSGVVGV